MSKIVDDLRRLQAQGVDIGWHIPWKDILEKLKQANGEPQASGRPTNSERLVLGQF